MPIHIDGWPLGAGDEDFTRAVLGQLARRGAQVGFTFNGATSPADAWSFDIATLNLTRWTEAETGGLNPEKLGAAVYIRNAVDGSIVQTLNVRRFYQRLWFVQ